MKKSTKRALRRFWREWGVSKEEVKMFIGAVAVIMIPFLTGYLVKLFGI